MTDVVIELVHIVDDNMPTIFNINSCMARKSDGTQCGHKKKMGDYCGVHLKKIHVLRIDEPIIKKIKKERKTNRKRIVDCSTQLKNTQGSSAATRIQSAFRGWIVRKSNQLRGPGFANVSLCNNAEDIYLLESLSEIHPDDIFTMKDKDGFIYGFHIESIYKYVVESNRVKGQITNPYNKSVITNDTVQDIKKLYRLCRIKGVRNTIENILPNDAKFVFRNKVITVFQKMDELNNYTDIDWFMNLTNIELIRLVYLIKDLFDYRMELSTIKKSKIIKAGCVFYRDNNYYKHLSFSNLRNEIIDELNRLVSEGETRDDCYLGSLIILSGLVELDQNCADAYPWLVQGTFNN
jgi:hypothetical protein